MFSWRCFPFVESAPRAYRLKASNAAPSSSTSTGTIPSEGIDSDNLTFFTSWRIAAKVLDKYETVCSFPHQKENPKPYGPR
jgi:hypothetical protein